MRRLRRNRKFSIQNSRFKINWVLRTHLSTCFSSGRSLRRDAKFGNELRASAGRRLRPAAVPCRNRKFRIHNSRFKIKSGCSLRSARTSGLADARCGPSPPPGCGPPGPDGPIPETSPQPSGRACDVEEQPSARGRLRAAGRCATEFAGRHFDQNCGCGLLAASTKPQIQHSKFKIQN